MGGNLAYPMQTPASVAYTRKDFSGYWGYEPPAGIDHRRGRAD